MLRATPGSVLKGTTYSARDLNGGRWQARLNAFTLVILPLGPQNLIHFQSDFQMPARGMVPESVKWLETATLTSANNMLKFELLISLGWG